MLLISALSSAVSANMIISSIVALISFAGALPSTISSNGEHDAAYANAIPKKLKTGAQAAPSIEDQVRLWERTTGTKFERKLGNLPLSYTKPDLLEFSFSSFALYSFDDGLNKIQRTLYGNYSISEKYANAFGLNVRGFQDTVSKKSGVDAHSNRKVCSADSQCDPERGIKCGIRNGKKTGYCIPHWFGVCHAQAPLKILELAPRCPVTMNNVTFYPEDIDALFSQFYDGFNLNPIFAGARYNGPKTPELDGYGRPKDPAHRDVNPGMYVLALTNMIGIQKRAILQDSDSGPEVWNSPIGTYNLTSLKRFTLEEGAQKFWNVTKYPFNSNAASLVYMLNDFNGFVLELNSDDEIIGGEWLPQRTLEPLPGTNEWQSKTTFRHPDFLWLPTSKPSIHSVSDIGIPYSHMAELLRKSRGASCVEYCQKRKQLSLDYLNANLQKWCRPQRNNSTEYCYKSFVDEFEKTFEKCSQPIV
jgi:hypothetical protein